MSGCVMCSKFTAGDWKEEYDETNAAKSLPKIDYEYFYDDYCPQFNFSFDCRKYLINQDNKEIDLRFYNCEELRWLDENNHWHIEPSLNCPYIGCGEPKCVRYDNNYGRDIEYITLSIKDLDTEEIVKYKVVKEIEDNSYQEKYFKEIFSDDPDEETINKNTKECVDQDSEPF